MDYLKETFNVNVWCGLMMLWVELMGPTMFHGTFLLLAVLWYTAKSNSFPLWPVLGSNKFQEVLGKDNPVIVLQWLKLEPLRETDIALE